MAVYRETPTCPFCGDVIAKGIYNTKSQKIGDNFIRWEYKNHSCKKMREWKKKQPKIEFDIEQLIKNNE